MKKVTDSALAVLAMSLVLASSLSLAQGQPPAEDEGESILVGRISHVEGWALRYIPEEREWERTVKDAPFGLEDKVRTDKDARVEVILPNNTWVRMEELSQLELVSLKNDETAMHMVYGAARFYSRGSDSRITVTTPFGHVTSPGKTTFDLFVSDTSLEVVSRKGSAFFTPENGRSRHEIIAGSSSLVFDGHRIAAGVEKRDSQWDAWNAERDNLWDRRMRAGGISAKYLPPVLDDQAYILEDYGVWERVYYNGQYGYLWRPIHVGVGWAPFTVGRWSVWYGDQVWIPAEPFGYVTHHYGNWVFVGRYWYWAPPLFAVGVQVGHPGLTVRFGWYPGRVAWIHFGINVGWVPLAPHEPYYCHRHWGPRSIVVRDVHVTNVQVNRYVNINRAVVVKNQDFYRVNNYRNYRVRDVDQRTIASQYRAAPLIDQKIVPDRGRERYSFSPQRTERSQQSVSSGGGLDRPSAAKVERTEKRAPSGGAEQPGRTPTRQEKGKLEERPRPDAVKKPSSSAKRSAGEQGGPGKDGNRSTAPEIQGPRAVPSEGRAKGGGPEASIPQRGKPEREVKEGVRGGPGNSPRSEISLPEKVEKESEAPPTADPRSRPSRASNQDRKLAPEKKEQQRGGRGRE